MTNIGKLSISAVGGFPTSYVNVISNLVILESRLQSAAYRTSRPNARQYDKISFVTDSYPEIHTYIHAYEKKTSFI